MFKPGDKVKRIGETHFRYKHRTPLDVIKGYVYTVHECISPTRITLVGKGSFTYGPENFELMEEGKMSECTCNKKTPHVHAELIKAWSDGAIIQFEDHFGEWKDTFRNYPKWFVGTNYRIKPEPKPEPKPDVVKYAFVDTITGHQYWISPIKRTGANVTFTFDGETGKLKSAEIIA